MGYYGVLANRSRGRLLPIVYGLLNQTIPENSLPVRWSFLLKSELGIDPLICMICKQRLKLAKITVGDLFDQSAGMSAEIQGGYDRGRCTHFTGKQLACVAYQYGAELDKFPRDARHPL